MFITEALKFGLGLYQTIRGAIEQNKLNKMPVPKYGLTSSMKSAKSQAEQMAQMGYTPQERAAFEQRLATGSNTAFRRAVDMSGGNMAQAIQGALNAQNIMGQNQFAASDAALRRQNIAARNQIYGQEQALDNQNVAMQNQLMMARMQSLGAQRQSGFENLFEGLGGLGGGLSDLLMLLKKAKRKEQTKPIPELEPIGTNQIPQIPIETPYINPMIDRKGNMATPFQNWLLPFLSNQN